MKKTLIFTVGLLIMMSILVNCAAATPVKNSENGHWYEVVGSSITWENAKTAAQASSYSGMSGHLATITSQKENNFVSSLGSVEGCWLGGFQSAGSSEPNGGWQWVTGESWSNGNNMYGYIVEYEPTTTSVPEFPSIVLPVAAILGILVISGRRKI